MDEKKINELFEKYGLIFEDNKRYYKMPLNKRVYGYDRSTFKRLIINGFVIEEDSWTAALIKMVEFLQSKFNKEIEELVSFHTSWSKADIFGIDQFMTNSREVIPGLFVSINFTYTHFIWVIQDLLEFYGVDSDDCELIVRTPTMGEPEEIKKIIRETEIEQFKNYLLNKGFDESSIKKCVGGIDTINKVLVKMNCSDNDFYLIDQEKTFSSIRNRLITYNNTERIFNQKQVNTISKILTLLREAKGFAKKHIK